MNKRPPEKLPDPWLFDSEQLLERLERCRELVMNIPICDVGSTHEGIKSAVTAIWNLQNDLRYLLHLHREGQRSFARQHAAQEAKAQKGKEKIAAGNVVKLVKFKA